MRGKVVNLCVGAMNIVLGFLLLVYTIYMPKEITEFTVQELTVKSNVLNAIYVLLILSFLIDLFQYRNNRDNARMKTGYLFGFFTIIFLFSLVSIIIFLSFLFDYKIILSFILTFFKYYLFLIYLFRFLHCNLLLH